MPKIISPTICLDVTLGVEMLLEAGADTKITDNNKKTALDHAVAKGTKIFLQKSKSKLIRI